MPDASDAPQHLSAPGWKMLPDDRDEAIAALRRHFAEGGELLGDASGASVLEPELPPAETPQSPDPNAPEPTRLDLEPSLAEILQTRMETPEVAAEPEVAEDESTLAEKMEALVPKTDVLEQVLRIFEMQRAAIDEAISTIRNM